MRYLVILFVLLSAPSWAVEGRFRGSDAEGKCSVVIVDGEGRYDVAGDFAGGTALVLQELEEGQFHPILTLYEPRSGVLLSDAPLSIKVVFLAGGRRPNVTCALTD